MPSNSIYYSLGIGVGFNRHIFTEISSRFGQKMIFCSSSGSSLTYSCINTYSLIFIHIGICQCVGIGSNGIDISLIKGFTKGSER